MSREYKSVDARHRVLTALEKLWAKYPTDQLTQLIERVRLPDENGVRDETILRRINRKLSG